MKILGENVFGLEICCDFLPPLKGDEALDRVFADDLTPFARGFAYDLRRQTFVEKRNSESREQTRFINVQNLSEAVQRRGFGIIDTAVGV